MPKSSRRRRRTRGDERPQHVWSAAGPRSARQAAPDLSREARARLAMLDWHRTPRRERRPTARHFGYSRPTVYRWLGRYDRHRLETPRGPPARAPPPAPADLDARRASGGPPLRTATRAGARTSSRSSSGARDGRSRPPWSGGSSRRLRRRAISRAAPPADERPAAALAPTLCDPQAGRLAVRRPAISSSSTRSTSGRCPTGSAKQFTARDVVSRWDVLELGGGRPPAAARCSIASPRACRSRSGPSASTTAPSSWPSSRPPVPGAGIRPVRPAAPQSQAPRRRRARQPDPHRGVLRDHRAEPDLAAFPVRAARLGAVYNTVRPHQALGYLTPAEYLASLGIDV